jgi:hypothetical protein
METRRINKSTGVYRNHMLALAVLATCVAATAWAGTRCPDADLNSDCKVNFKDMAVLASDWLVTKEKMPLPDVNDCCQRCIPYIITDPDTNVEDPNVLNSAIDYCGCMFKLILDYKYASLTEASRTALADYNDLATQAISNWSGMMKYYAPTFSPTGKKVLVYTVAGWPKVKLPGWSPGPIPNPLDKVQEVINGIAHEGQDLLKTLDKAAGSTDEQLWDAAQEGVNQFAKTEQKSAERALDMALDTEEGQLAKAAMNTALDEYDEAVNVIDAAR